MIYHRENERVRARADKLEFNNRACVQKRDKQIIKTSGGGAKSCFSTMNNRQSLSRYLSHFTEPFSDSGAFMWLLLMNLALGSRGPIS